MYHYDTDFGPTEMWSASAEWTPQNRESATQLNPVSAKTLFTVGLLASLVSIALGTLAFGTMKGNQPVALAETSVPVQVSGWTNLK